MKSGKLIGSVPRAHSRSLSDKAGPDSRTFYSPLHVRTEDPETVILIHEHCALYLWPEEAEALGLFLIKAAHEVNS